MLRTLASLAVVGLAVPAAAANAERGVSGVKKVIEMLEALSVKSKKERDEDQIAQASFNQSCVSRLGSLQNDIKENGLEAEKLKGETAALQADITKLGDALTQLNQKVAGFESEATKAKKQREKDSVTFLQQSKDFAESIDALGRAVKVLKEKAVTKKAAQSLLQISASNPSQKQVHSIVAAFLGMAQQEGEPAYQHQSGGIISMLKNLQEEFKVKLSDVEKTESSNVHANQLVIQDLAAAIKVAKADIQDKTADVGAKKEKVAANDKALATVVALKVENNKTLQANQVECTTKAAEYEARQKLRAEEIKALDEATAVLKSPEVLGTAQKKLGFLQLSATALVQLSLRSSNNAHLEAIRHDLVTLLNKEGSRLHSQSFSLLAQSAAADPFVKVKGLIEDMIKKLTAEAEADATNKGFCDNELKKSKSERAALSEKLNRLKASTEESKASLLQLNKSIAELGQEVVSLDTLIANATKLREAESKSNAETIQEAQAAQKAVAKATEILKAVYSKKGAALLQVDRSHLQAATEKVSGVLALLEVVASDFAALEKKTKEAEATNDKLFKKTAAESKRNKEVKQRSITSNTDTQVKTEAKLNQATTELKATKEQLESANKFFEKLQPQCFPKELSHEEKKKARQEEREALQQALEMLSQA